MRKKIIIILSIGVFQLIFGNQTCFSDNSVILRKSLNDEEYRKLQKVMGMDLLNQSENSEHYKGLLKSEDIPKIMREINRQANLINSSKKEGDKNIDIMDIKLTTENFENNPYSTTNCLTIVYYISNLMGMTAINANSQILKKLSGIRDGIFLHCYGVTDFSDVRVGQYYFDGIKKTNKNLRTQ